MKGKVEDPAETEKSSSSDVFESHRTKLDIPQRLVEKYHMKPHPEGGFYAETYRAISTVTSSYGTRAAGTAILFLITPGSVSRLHRLASDETWHFYLGGPMTVVELSDAGVLKKTVLGSDVLGGEQRVQYTVKAGTWFGSYPNKGSPFSFVGCTVAPGFEFDDFELASQAKLLGKYPQHSEEIKLLTKGLP